MSLCNLFCLIALTRIDGLDVLVSSSNMLPSFVLPLFRMLSNSLAKLQKENQKKKSCLMSSFYLQFNLLSSNKSSIDKETGSTIEEAIYMLRCLVETFRENKIDYIWCLLIYWPRENI